MILYLRIWKSSIEFVYRIRLERYVNRVRSLRLRRCLIRNNTPRSNETFCTRDGHIVCLGRSRSAIDLINTSLSRKRQFLEADARYVHTSHECSVQFARFKRTREYLRRFLLYIQNRSRAFSTLFNANERGKFTTRR